jgi:hypothetical protein
MFDIKLISERKKNIIFQIMAKRNMMSSTTNHFGIIKKKKTSPLLSSPCTLAEKSPNNLHTKPPHPT